MNRRDFVLTTAAGGLSFPLGAESLAANVPPKAFSKKYLALRERFFKDFEFNGHVAYSAEGNHRTFTDQTLHMGFALVTFAGEARLCARAGGDPRPTERVVRRLLDVFEKLDKDAERELFGTAVPGFFVRDYVKALPGLEVASDFLKGPDTVAMSLDQAVSMLMGWWAVSHWSTDAENRKLARAQADRVMDYLLAQRFLIEKPGTRNLVRRGPEARAAAGFLCNIGEEITGEDYYHKAKVRLTPDNKCHTCAGTGQVNVPDPNLHCPGCNGSGHAKIVVGGGKCGVCRGSGEVKLVTESKCPTCRGTGEIRVVVTNPFTGEDKTLGKSKCRLCGGDGKVGGKTSLGKCKVCGGDGKLPSYTKDLGECKLCGGSGRLKGKLPKVKCPVCGGSKELNLYVRVTHPLVLALEPLTLLGSVPKGIRLVNGKPSFEWAKAGPSYGRHINLVCMAFEEAIPDAALLLAAKDSNHPWVVALRAAMGGTVCRICQGHGKRFLMVEDAAAGGAGSPLKVNFTRHEMGPCKACGGKGLNTGLNPSSLILQGALGDIVRIHAACPPDGPSDRSPSIEWVKSNRWERCTDLTRSKDGNARYNGLDFLSLEVLVRLAGAGNRLRE